MLPVNASDVVEGMSWKYFLFHFNIHGLWLHSMIHYIISLFSNTGAILRLLSTPLGLPFGINGISNYFVFFTIGNFYFLIRHFETYFRLFPVKVTSTKNQTRISAAKKLLIVIVVSGFTRISIPKTHFPCKHGLTSVSFRNETQPGIM